MHKRKFFYLIFALLLIPTSCGLFNQQHYHKIFSNYNLLYNGRKSLELGIEKINQNHVPNFYEITLIDPFYSNGTNRYFSFAENRANTVLEQHTIENEPIWEQSHLIQAHLMLLKSCYFQNKNASNLELLNQFEFQKLESPLNFELLYWTIKNLLNNGQNQKAIEKIKQFENADFVDDQQDIELQKLLAQVLLNEKEYKLASTVIEKIIENHKKNQFRIQFTLAQILVHMNQYDIAKEHFKQLVNQKSDNLYVLQGKLALIESNQNLSEETQLFLYEELLDYKIFRKFDYYIHNRLGKHYFNQKQFQRAREFFVLSNNAQNIDRFTYQNNLKSIYRLELESENFIEAFVSLNAIIDNQKSKDSLLKQRNALVDLIDLDNEIKMIVDSIGLTSMTEKELKLRFDQNIENRLSQTLVRKTTAGKTSSDSPVDNEQLDLFENSDVFKNQWGERPNVDNWRYSTLLGGNYSQRIDFTSDQISIQEKEILWNEYNTKVRQFKSDLAAVNQRIAQKTIELINLYLLFGLTEQSKALLEKRKNYFLSTNVENSYLELENKLKKSNEN